MPRRRPTQQRLAETAAAVVRVAGVLAGPELALEAARTIVAWAHGFIGMSPEPSDLAGTSITHFAFGIERLASALER